MNQPEDRFDAVVIGSGIGGLAAASLLAGMHGWRVCVLERHGTPGGFTHSFRRPGGWEWDVGLHYVGDLAPGSLPRRLMDRITGGRVGWHPLPEPIETFHFPHQSFTLPGNAAAAEAQLAAAFPGEAKALSRYFRQVRQEALRLQLVAAGDDSLPSGLNRLLRRVGALTDFSRSPTTRAVLERTIRAPLLRTVLTAQWGDFGLSPSDSPFCLHALIADHYFRGAWYPEGGSATLARAATAEIEAAGGAVLVRHRVERIVVEDGRAVGVEAVTRRAGQDQRLTLQAPVIISDAGAYNTFAHLLPPELGAPLAQRLAPFVPPLSAVQVFLGLHDSPALLGLNGGNIWFFDGYDHDALARRDWPRSGRPGCVLLSLPSLRGGKPKPHTAEIVALAPLQAFDPWRSQTWQQRDPAYQALKQTIARDLIALAERHYPGFAALVATHEVATPLTVEHFTASPGGAIYGLPCSAERLSQVGLLGVRTPVPGLLLTGADALFPGIVGAAMAGLGAAGAALGPLGLPRLMAGLYRS